ncbi:hypothetical protein EI546_05925 [Aequorivita sp. H23M31]|uniref:Sulfotransferase family protein n=1 Tax=Aequorivita ciconiae TaxID=2494375 RepID=A0A410G209_9FLAO|nr:sulfotransferase family 2 domain-containing protein [Aequorivita sp. H23M31]QAA81293.1 hypothetical protein EI546_05925 [Aequorivita sp. H23M31]
MVISKVHKYIYVAVDKTGTTSVEKFLMDSDETATKNGVEIDGKQYKFKGHSTALEIKAVLGKHYDDYTVIGFVRNPYSRVVSSYFFLKKGAKPWKNVDRDRPLIQKLQIKFTQIMPFKPWALIYPYRANRIYFVGEKGNLIVDKIGIFENLSEDLETILISCGLNFDFSKFPHTNKSVHKEESTYFKNKIFRNAMSLKLGKDLKFYNSIEEANNSN